MDIALLFSEDFPAQAIAGQCIPLRQGKGVYTLGRNDETHHYDIDVQNQHLSRKQATLTFHYNAAIQAWQVSDAGFNHRGELVPYENRCQVNGEFIPRNEDDIPDPVTIDPEDKKRILIGGDTRTKILVLPECETTLDQAQDPFDGELWGTDIWQRVSEQPDNDDEEGKTVGVDLGAIKNSYLRDLVVLSQATGHGLADPDTRLQTTMSILSAVGLLLSILCLYWIATILEIAPTPGPKYPAEMEKTGLD